LTYFQVILSSLRFEYLSRLASGIVRVKSSALTHLIRGAESFFIVVLNRLSLGPSSSLEIWDLFYLMLSRLAEQWSRHLALWETIVGVAWVLQYIGRILAKSGWVIHHLLLLEWKEVSLHTFLLLVSEKHDIVNRPMSQTFDGRIVGREDWCGLLKLGKDIIITASLVVCSVKDRKHVLL
jgi:hypothetical protein